MKRGKDGNNRGVIELFKSFLPWLPRHELNLEMAAPCMTSGKIAWFDKVTAFPLS
jgi:hypothetical protein